VALVPPHHSLCPFEKLISKSRQDLGVATFFLRFFFSGASGPFPAFSKSPVSRAAVLGSSTLFVCQSLSICFFIFRFAVLPFSLFLVERNSSCLPLNEARLCYFAFLFSEGSCAHRGPFLFWGCYGLSPKEFPIFCPPSLWDTVFLFVTFRISRFSAIYGSPHPHATSTFSCAVRRHRLIPRAFCTWKWTPCFPSPFDLRTPVGLGRLRHGWQGTPTGPLYF